MLQLFDRALSGDATDDELRALEELLDGDQQACDLYAEYARFGVDLRYGFRTKALLGNAHAPRRTSVQARAEGQAHSWTRRGAVAVLVAMAAGLLIALIPTAEEGEVAEAPAPRALRPPAPVATLATHSNAVWRGQQLQIGQSIREGSRVTLVRGSARISVGAGAELFAKGPCELQFVSDDVIQLNEGEVTVNVAEWASGFRVVTDVMEVVDLGTTFSVSASRESGVKTRVLRGEVRAVTGKTREASARGVLLTSGEVLSVDGAGRHIGRSVAAVTDLAAFDFGGLQPYRPIEVHNTGREIAVGDEDPHWRVVAGPAEHIANPQPVVICQPGKQERYLPNESAVSQWVSVRDWRAARSNSTYTFQTQFHLDGYDVGTVTLFGRFLADNGIKEVRVNGSPVRVDSWTDNASGQAFSQSEFRFVNVTDGLAPGVNTVEIDVWNGVFQEPSDQRDSPVNPMALRVEWYAFGRHAI